MDNNTKDSINNTITLTFEDLHQPWKVIFLDKNKENDEDKCN